MSGWRLLPLRYPQYCPEHPGLSMHGVATVRPGEARSGPGRPPFVMYCRTSPPSALRRDLTAAGFTVTTVPLTTLSILGGRQDGSPRARLILSRTPSTP
jgi:hypothetical protein